MISALELSVIRCGSTYEGLVVNVETILAALGVELLAPGDLQ
jgi:hypothetical protein